MVDAIDLRSKKSESRKKPREKKKQGLVNFSSRSSFLSICTHLYESVSLDKLVTRCPALTI